MTSNAVAFHGTNIDIAFVDALDEGGVQVLTAQYRSYWKDPKRLAWPSAEEVARLLGIHVVTTEELQSADPTVFRHWAELDWHNARIHEMLPFRLREDTVDVAMVNPAAPSLFVADNFRLRYGRRLQRFAVSSLDLAWAIMHFSRS